VKIGFCQKLQKNLFWHTVLKKHHIVYGQISDNAFGMHYLYFQHVTMFLRRQDTLFQEKQRKNYTLFQDFLT
jgi:hypothetical protein